MNLIDVHTHFFPDDMKSNKIKYCKIDANFNQLYANEDAQIYTEDDLKMILDNNSKLKIVIQSIGYTDYELTKYTNDFLIELSHKYRQVKTLGSINPAWSEGKSVDELKGIFGDAFATNTLADSAKALASAAETAGKVFNGRAERLAKELKEVQRQERLDE